ncbi:hypothetical protein PCE1_002320 [Barthelona sp. PCE]
MSKSSINARKTTNIAQQIPNNVPKCSFRETEFWISQCDDRTWKITSLSGNTGLSTHAQLDPEISSLISDTLPGKAFMACSSMYGALGVVSSNSGDGVCETHYRTFKHDDDGIQILNQVVVPEVHTHISVFDRAMGAIKTNQNVLTTYMILNDGLLVNKTEHNLPFPITSFIMCPHNWVIVTKQLHLNDSAVGLFNLESEEQALLPYIVTSLDVTITVNNSFTFEAANAVDRSENVFISLSFPSSELYTLSMSNIEIDNTIQKSMNKTAKPGGITTPANTEDCEILPVIDISAPTAHIFQSAPPIFQSAPTAPVYVAPKPQAMAKQPEREVPMGKREIEVDKVLHRDFKISLLVESGMLNIKYSNQKLKTNLSYKSDFQYLVSGRSDGAVICEYSGASGTLFFFKSTTGTMLFTHCFEYNVADDLPSDDFDDVMIVGHGKYCVLCFSFNNSCVIFVINTVNEQIYYEHYEYVLGIHIYNEFLVIHCADCIVHSVITDDGLSERKEFELDECFDELRPFHDWIVFREYFSDWAFAYNISQKKKFQISLEGYRQILDLDFNPKDQRIQQIIDLNLCNSEELDPADVCIAIFLAFLIIFLIALFSYYISKS